MVMRICCSWAPSTQLCADIHLCEREREPEDRRIEEAAHGFVHGGFLAPTPAESTLCLDPVGRSGSTWETLRASSTSTTRWKGASSRRPAPIRASRTTRWSASTKPRDLPLFPNYSFPTVYDTYELLNFGPHFNSVGGVLTIVPPHLGASTVSSCPKPTATASSWQACIRLRRAYRSARAWDGTCARPAIGRPTCAVLTGSYFPFATTRHSGRRLASRDRLCRSSTAVTRAS